MLGDTFVLPQAGGDITLRKVNNDNYSTEYFVRAADGLSEYVVRVRHTKTSATAVRPVYDRHNVEVVQTVYQAGDVQEYYRKMYFVIEHKPSDSAIALYDALADKVIASSNALLVGLLNRES
jgi:nitrogenase subunit NifH